MRGFALGVGKMGERRERVGGYVIPEVKIALNDAALAEGRSLANYVGWLLTNAIKNKLTPGAMMKARAAANQPSGRPAPAATRTSTPADAAAIQGVPLTLPPREEHPSLVAQRRASTFRHSVLRFQESAAAKAMTEAELADFKTKRFAEFQAGLRDEIDIPPGPLVHGDR